MKTYHFYDQETFEYTHTGEVKPDRIPKNAVETATGKPESLKEGERLIWSIAQNQWTVLTEKQFTEMLIGMGVKSKSLKEKVAEDGRIIPKAAEELIGEGILTLENLKEQKMREISEQCRKRIVSGFESSVKGSPYIYDTELEDQFNIKTLIEMGKDADIRCTRKSDMVKTYYPHKFGELVMLVTEFSAFKITILRKAEQNRSTVNALNDPIAVYNYKMVWE